MIKTKALAVGRIMLQKQAGGGVVCFFVCLKKCFIYCAIGIMSFILNQRLSCSVQCHEP